LAIAALLLLTFYGHASAQEPNWISVSSIHDITGNLTLQNGQPLITGHSYNLTLGVAVPFSQTASHFTMNLYVGVNASGNQYWYVHGSYAGYNSSTLVAGSKVISFTQMKGAISLSAVFTLPKALTTNQQAGVTLHFNQNDFPIAQAVVTGGAEVGSAKVTVSDEVIQNYLSLYGKASTYIPTGKIDKAYTAIVDSTVAQAQGLYNEGLPIEATNLLNTLDPAAFPAPPSSTLMYALFGGVAILAVLTVAFAIMATRSRAKRGYSSSIMGDVQRDLASLEVIAVKYDRSLADKLKGLRDKLTEAAS
jgi:hypothetical protein